MTTASEKMIQAIEYVVKSISIGMNMALSHLLWAMVSGAFLSSRGAVHTALKLSGRSDAETRRGGKRGCIGVHLAKRSKRLDLV